MGAAYYSRDGGEKWTQPVRRPASSMVSCSSHLAGGAVEIGETDGVDAAAERTLAQLADNILPFVPCRVAQAFGSGRLNSALTGAVLPPNDPQKLDAAVLLVDVSGFTKLSEAYSRKGPEGCEHFSLIMSSFLARMSDIIAIHDGDIDCFAGDALLVVFSVEKDGVAQSQCEPGGGGRGDGVLQQPRVRGRSTVGGESLRSGSDRVEDCAATPGQARQQTAAVGRRIRVVRRTLTDLALRLGKTRKSSKGSSELDIISASSPLCENLNTVVKTSDAPIGLGLGPADRKKGAPAKRSASVISGLGRRQGNTAKTRLAASVSSAISCAVAISQELSGFQASPQDPPLSIHAGLAAGEIYAIECGGSLCPRSETFIAGEPLNELAVAMRLSSASEMVVGPSARLKGVKGLHGDDLLQHGCLRIRLPSSTRNEDRSSGCQQEQQVEPGFSATSGQEALRQLVWDRARSIDRLMRNAKNKQANLGIMNAKTGQISTGDSPIVRQGSGISMNGSALTSPSDDESLAELLFCSKDSYKLCSKSDSYALCCSKSDSYALCCSKSDSYTLCIDESQDSATGGSPTKPGLKNTARRRRRPSRQLSHVRLTDLMDKAQHEIHDSMEALLRFVPQFVRQRCLAGLPLDTMPEHRHVTVVFIVGKTTDMPMTIASLKQLQANLGRAIDVAAGEYGGVTRQITMDDKGLAALFVFGLPGSTSRPQMQAQRCVSTAIKAVEILNQDGLSCTAGIAHGPCFCGLVGDPNKRCEYAVLGDTVNTAARIAGLAAKRGDSPILVTEAFVDTAAKQPMLCGDKIFVLSPVCSVTLKGKAQDVTLFALKAGDLRPGRKLPTVQRRIRKPSTLLHREAESKEIREFLCRRCCLKGCCGLPRGPAMLVIEGLVGLGKTALLSHMADQIIPHEAECFKGKEPLHVLQFQAVKDKRTPFGMCHALLKALLQKDGEQEAEAERFSLLESEGLAITECCLPGLLKPHALELRRLGDLPVLLKPVSYQNLYARIFSETLMKEAMVLVIDDAQDMDEGSMAVVAKVGLAWSAKPDNSGQSAIVLTTLGQLPYKICNQNTLELVTGDLTNDPEVPHIELNPFNDEIVSKIATQAIGSKALTGELAAVISGESQGNPLHVNELCRWLMDRYILEISQTGVAGLREKARSSVNFSPPSLHNIMRSQVDQLPPKLGMVLRYASILGTGFQSAMLFRMLPSKVAESEEALALLLDQLEGARIVENANCEGHGEDHPWQFCQVVCKDVVYNTMLHKCRRKLHKVAAALLQGQADEVASNERDPVVCSYNLWTIQEQLVNQWLKVVTGVVSKAQAFQYITAEDLLAASRAVHTRLLQLFSAGHWVEALRVQDMLQSSVTVDNEHNVPKAWIQAKMRVTELSLQACFRMSGFADVFGTVISEEVTRARIQELVLLQEHLMLQLDALSSDSSSHDLRDLETMPDGGHAQCFEGDLQGPHGVGWALRGGLHTINANAKTVSSLIEYGTNNWSLSRVECEKLIARFYTTKNVEAKVIYASIVGLLGWSTMLVQVTKVAEDAMHVYRKAGMPNVTMLIPMSVSTSIIVLTLSCQLFCGTLQSELVAGSIQEITSTMDYGQRIMCYGILRIIEGCCDSQVSPRVQHWRTRIQLEENENGGLHTEWGKVMKHVMLIDMATDESHILGPHLWADSPASAEPSVPVLEQRRGSMEAAAAAETAWRALVSQAFEEAITTSAILDPWAIARTIVYECCRVMFPRPGAPSGSSSNANKWSGGSPGSSGAAAQTERGTQFVTQLGLRHMQEAVRLLSRALAYWEERNRNRFVPCLPAAGLFGRAMLHWFQWKLSIAGFPVEGGIEDRRAPVGLRGHDKGPSLPAGLPSVCSGLLMAQAVSVADEDSPEPMTACLPATLALARMLAGQGGPLSVPRFPLAPSYQQDSSSGMSSAALNKTRFMVPLLPPTGGSISHQAVASVEIGTPEALGVAHAHLEAMASRITVESKKVVLADVTCAKEVGDSETLWAAAQLYHEIGDMCPSLRASKTPRRTAWTTQLPVGIVYPHRHHRHRHQHQ